MAMRRNRISESDDNINIAVKDQHNVQLYFKMNKNLPVRKVLAAFCKKRQVDYRTVTFLLDGCRVPLNKTPIELKMENNAEIEVMSSMSGGGRSGKCLVNRFFFANGTKRLERATHSLFD
ncbi:putative small ubiquitin-related modifier 8 isoform X2 [Cynara cardunculus var. scolymus]|uniref:putative small ubiquitin-related modifier 8 isoform X2 n=1 Tax=Cynara cardunculus var. scolymus TaxID=59895 RepID=UPI000D629C58|nr:putative small ubiquitin-related modifier 8 isoform X2 [Cynara cardunculus var. scolymus]XP_024986417.1 putative small ubiquitin-related modifier 8 isoform X2 [Cynara cardunculus var. scolymus]